MCKEVMNKSIKRILTAVAGVILCVSCDPNLLIESPTDRLSDTQFWNSLDDAETSLYGTLAHCRNVFYQEFFLDGHGEYVRMNNNKFKPSGYGSRFDAMYKSCYTAINHLNYTIDHTNEFLKGVSDADDVEMLERVVGEAKLWRATVYLRLVAFWGDVPLLDHIVTDMQQVDTIGRTSIAALRKFMVEDLTYAFEKLPEPGATIKGRSSKVAALAMRGKVNLYWASWNNFGWPEVAEMGTFKASKTEALSAYKAAMDDFEDVINDYGLTLFRDGEPGDWGEIGKCDVLPNYFYLFQPEADGCSEMIMTLSYGGQGTDQSEQLMYEFGNYSTEKAPGRLTPRSEIIDRYQSTVTGDFCEPVVRDPNAKLKNGACNPETYRNRDYRMKATMLWNGESMPTMMELKDTGVKRYMYKQYTGTAVGAGGDELELLTVSEDETGLIFRKFVRDHAGAYNNEGDYDFPLIRLADVYLMYAEAANEFYGGYTDQALALVNKVRHRGNLPELAPEKYSTKEAFFEAIKQERIVELIGEGQRQFDIRRWRDIANVFGPAYGSGVHFFDTKGSDKGNVWKAADPKSYQKCYVFQFPTSEVDRNPNIDQTPCWN